MTSTRTVGNIVTKKSRRSHGHLGRHSGKYAEFFNYHFDMNYQGPSKEWIKRQALPEPNNTMYYNMTPTSKSINISNTTDNNSFQQEFYKSNFPSLCNNSEYYDNQDEKQEIYTEDLSQWPSLNNTETAVSAIRESSPVNFAEVLLVIEDDEGEEWICLNSKPKYRDALCPQASDSKDDNISICSSHHSNWMIIDDMADMDASITEEEVYFGVSDKSIENNKENVFFFEED